ncbi:MAG: N-acetylmuramoyl-L-alanine amidase [Rhodobacteraceae bacterium]|nr:MAG: N-acetylmuramoyl-L-alanine amidase [Paracoccaceae bacterium]
MVVIHYTAMATAEAALARLRDPAAEVSAHYLIAEDGRVWRLVAETRRAWHAGRAAWGGETDVNSRSVGIELANPGDAPFPEPQMAALERLLAALAARWPIPPERVLGHACVAPDRKRDPGGRFDWRRLARGGFAVWLDPPYGAPEPGGEAGPDAFAAAARRFGYGDAPGALAAFRRRFRPFADPHAPLTGADVAHLSALAARWPALRAAPSGAT